MFALQRVVEKQGLESLLSSRGLFHHLRAPERGGYNSTSVSWSGRKQRGKEEVNVQAMTVQSEAAVMMGSKQKFGKGK